MIAREPDVLLAEARDGSRVALARLLTYVESGGEFHRGTVALAYGTRAPYVVGLTGSPGSGKSTITDRLITTSLERAKVGDAESIEQVSVLCVDPTSPFSGGAILGDRIRMQDHATNEHVFIRSMATRGHLGGLSLAVPDAVRVLGAAGFPFVIVETVGVGQMEVEIASAADTTIVVTNPGWGDSMQANKAGLLEVADLFVINKADRPGVKETRRDLEQMLDLGRERVWRPLIVETTATDGAGVDELFDAIDAHRRFLDDELLGASRRRRARVELDNVVAVLLRSRVSELSRGTAYEEQIEALIAGTTDPYSAAEGLLLDS
ncbi:MAG TPA: methylmalonyl Co-A mutase-associated GTPase MeaB [Acidimicrobiales bacterium]|nr:methylmalonyl Co-A mutase-associated GTPase MeaB [Acidimicrobiales bacterium]